MMLKESGIVRRPLAQCASIALVTAVLAACGGGGGGGGDGGTQTGDGAEGPGGGTGSCRATQNTVSNGLTLGACITVEAGNQRNDIGFKDVNSNVAITDFASKRYTLTVSQPVTTNQTFAVANDPATSDEDRCQNRLGSRTVLTLVKPQIPREGEPYSAVTSATQGTGGADPRADRCPTAAVQGPALSLRAIDFGTWELYLGGFENYYSGWVTPRRTNATVRPTRAVTFDGGGTSATGDNGIAVGYSFTRISSFGMSAALRDVRFADNRITGTIDTFQYSRLVGTRQEPEATLRRLTFTADVGSNGEFDGTLAGEGSVTPVTGGSASAGIVSGRIRGLIVDTGTAGFEVAARYQAVITVAGNTAGVARAVGSFAAAE